ncbi:H(+)/Cl(-) exchange transporter ClcA [Acuticoccus sp. M5D2P5]|uniref:H(+)/Cl(-) exchange transporter ClcA n=1 Tax=Acuticoccus kalidii TaxID=2910977 RepID=UPI001F2ED77C|nr:H(+)/Cl(-) exchange transporter ClcA [Acuticoccus kalidii]MCF3934814.1 H(+)/Cl(-) exchange transporter ClcA [Acuticoccus kalidii]
MMNEANEASVSPAPHSAQAADPSRRNDTTYYLIALFVGAMTGLIGTALHLGVDAILEWPKYLHRAVDLDLGHFLLLTGAVSATLVVLSVALVRNLAPEAGGSGVQEIEGAMAGLREVRWRRVLVAKFFGGFLSLGSGLVAGREGPTIHMGASIAQGASERLGLGPRDTRGLLAAGAAAGLAAAFGAPLASILFVIEETRRQFPYSLKTYSAVMIASVASGVVTEALTGRRPFMMIEVPDIAISSLPAFIGLGILLGFVGVAFNHCLVRAMDQALAFGSRVSFYVLPAIVGFVIGVLLIVVPEATQGGEALAVTLTTEHMPLITIAAVVLIRFVMTMASYSIGAPGGIFAPILALATAIGLFYGLVLDVYVPLPDGMLPALAVAAMGGLFSATVRAPLVGVVLLAELTGAYSILVPGIITCLVANIVADRLGGRPIYEVLLERTLRLSGTPVPDEAATGKTDEQKNAIGGWDQR